MHKVYHQPSQLDLTGNIEEKWKKFKEKFILFMKTTGKSKEDSKTQVEILLNHIGKDALRVFNTFNLKDDKCKDLDRVLQKFDDFYNNRKNVIHERFKFYNMVQKRGESFHSFLTDLRRAVIYCRFKDEEDMLRDRIVMGIFDKNLQKQLLQKADLTLKAAVLLCYETEANEDDESACEFENENDTFTDTLEDQILVGLSNGNLQDQLLQKTDLKVEAAVEVHSETDVSKIVNSDEEPARLQGDCESNGITVSTTNQQQKNSSQTAVEVISLIPERDALTPEENLKQFTNIEHNRNIEDPPEIEEKDSNSNHNNQILVIIGDENMESDGEGERKILQCLVCLKRFYDYSSLKRHKLIHTEEKQCPVCNKKLKNILRLNSHMRIHKRNNARFECKVCSKTFAGSSILASHMKYAHSDSSRKLCTICGKTFALSTNFNYHMRTHTKERPHQCEVCSKRFSRYFNMIVHMRIHSSEKPYACTNCSRTFRDEIRLKLHERIHSTDLENEANVRIHSTGLEIQPKEKLYECTICSRRFLHASTLKYHLRRHNGEKPFECTVCSKRFTAKNTLTLHMRSHTGEKPFQCTVCEKRFSSSARQRIHLRYHAKERPLACNFCGKRFAESTNLRRHTRVHTGEKPYTCKVCEKKYSDPISFKAHKRKCETAVKCETNETTEST